MRPRVPDDSSPESIDDLFRRYEVERHPHRRQRLHALWLLHRGVPVEETAARVGVSARTLQRWAALYRTGGVGEVLRRVPGHQPAGRRPRLTPEQRTTLAVRAEAGDFPTVADAVAWVRREWGVEYTYKGMYALLRRSNRPP